MKLKQNLRSITRKRNKNIQKEKMVHRKAQGKREPGITIRKIQCGLPISVSGR